MSTRTDNVVVTVTIDGKKSISELGKLESSAVDLKAELKGLKKGTEEWISANKKLDSVNADIKKMREEMGLAGMTVGQLTRYQRELNRELQNVTIGTTEYDKLKGKLDQVKGKLAETKNSVKNVADETKSGGGFMTSFFGNFVAGAASEALGKIVDFAKESHAAWQESKAANAQVEASLKSTGNAAGLYKKDIDALAETLQNKVKIDDDVIKQNAAVLLTFTNIKKGVFEEAMPAITDLAAKMDGDLKGATVQVGKALNDPIKGISALTKVGVSFTETQKQVITKLVETGDTASAQKLILAELNKEFGGSAEAAAKAQGPIAGFNIAMGELQEALGEKMEDGTNGLVEAGTELLTYFTELVQESEPVIEVFSGIWDSIKQVGSAIWDVIEALLPFETESASAGTVMKVLATVMQTVAVPFRALAAVTTYVSDTFGVLINSAKKVSNFFGTEFEIDPNATMEQANLKLAKNIAGIAQTYVDIWADSDKKVEKEAENSVQKRTVQEQELTKKQQKELEKREKAQQKHFDSLVKMWQDLQGKIDEIEHQQYLNTLSKNDREIQAINDRYNTIIAATITKEKELVDAKVISQQEFDTTISNLRALQQQEIAAKQAEYDAAEAERRKGVQTQVDYELMSAHERALADTQKHFNALIAAAEAEGIDTTALVKKRNDAIYEQNRAFREKDLWDEKRIQQEKAKAVTAFANLAGETAAFVEAIGAKHTAFGRIAAIAQIAIQTGQALAATIAGASAAAAAGGPAAPFLLAGYIASGVATVLGAFVQAKSALSSAPDPKPNSYGDAPSASSTSGNGGGSSAPKKAFAKGGSTLPTVAGGGYVPSYQVASFGELGPEYVIPHWLLQRPDVANIVGLLEQTRLRGFEVGGSTAAAAPAASQVIVTQGADNSAQMQQLISSVLAVEAAVREQDKMIRAFVVLSDIKDAENLQTSIEEEART